MSAVMEAREPSAKHLSTLQPPLVQQFDLLAMAPGGVAKLRELILTLAVQGKLVPQDPRDEPASELLKKACVEKDRLIAEGKIKRDKPLLPIEEEDEAFELPHGWEWVRLGEVVQVLDSLRKPVTKEDRRPGPYPYYGASGIVDYVSAYIFDEPLVLVGEDGAKWGAGDRTAFAISGKTWVNNHAHVLKPWRTVLADMYLVIFLTARDLSGFITGMTVPKLNQARLVSIPIALPPLFEQSRIVARVEELMRLCDALETQGQLEAAQHAQLVQTLLGALTASATPEELADNWQRVATHFDVLLDRPEAIDALEQTILQLAVRGLLVPQDPKDEPASELLQKIRAEKDRLIAEGKIKRDKPLALVTKEEKPFAVPRQWQWVRLRDLVSHLGDGLHGTPIYSASGEFFFVNGNNLGAGVITIKPETKRVDKSEFEKHRKPLDTTTVLLSINGTLGRVAFYQNEPIILGKSACYFNVTAGLQKLFARLLLECPDFMAYAEKSASGTTIKNLGLKAIGDWPIALPPLAEQSRIVARVESLRSLCADLRQRLAARQTTQAHLAEALIAEVA